MLRLLCYHMRIIIISHSGHHSPSLSLSLLQPSFLSSHLEREPTAAVSITVSASTHFRAIGDTRPASLHGDDREAEEIKNRSSDEGAQQGSRITVEVY